MTEDLEAKLKQAQILQIKQGIDASQAEIANNTAKTDAQKLIASSAASVASNVGWKAFWGRIWTILSTIGNVFKLVLRDLTPYIALIIVILLLIWISRRKSAPSMGRGGQMSAPELNWFDKYFLPSYQIRSLTNFFSGDPPGIDRPKEPNGRCDNIEWQHTGGSGTGLCVKTYKPDTITWTLDMDKMPELSKLPTKITDMMKVTDRMQVYIPWESQGTFYVPQCSKAYFKEMDSNGKEVTTSASYLFKDKGLTCERVEKDSWSYGTQYRPKDSVDLYDFATEKYPKCGDT